jgi:acetylornithine deacetylase/succinyl-diaminopimelate desuccinylase-like protein
MSRVNLIARLPGRGETGHLVFGGHMDVAPASEPAWASSYRRPSRPCVATGATSALNGVSGGTEAALLCRAYGMPLVICGPGQLADVHMVNASVAVAEPQRAVATDAHVARLLLG